MQHNHPATDQIRTRRAALTVEWSPRAAAAAPVRPVRWRWPTARGVVPWAGWVAPMSAALSEGLLIGWLVAASTLVLLGGCAGYQVGTRSLYAPNINTVYVPVFESASFRRGLGEQLTEAVVKQIELKTPYKVVGDAGADSILSGRLVTEKKRVLVEDHFDYAREVQVDLTVQVTWMDRHGVVLRQPTTIPVPANLVHFGQTATLVPEAGQSIATAHQEAVARLADQIVATMEAPW